MKFRKIDELTNKIANALLTEHFNKGDRVIIYMDNCLEAVAKLFEILKAAELFSS